MMTAPRHEDLLQHSLFVRRLAQSLVRDPHRAQDIAQDAMLVALERPMAGANLRSWLAGVTRNLARRSWRSEKRRRRHEAAVAPAAPTETAADSVSRLETTARLVAAVLALEEPYRTTVLRRYFDDETSADIARSEGVSPATVRSRLKRALEKLRERMDRECGGRRAWMAALLPMAASRDIASPAPATMSATVERAKRPWPFVAATVTIVVLVGLAAWHSRSVTLDEDGLVAGSTVARRSVRGDRGETSASGSSAASLEEEGEVDRSDGAEGDEAVSDSPEGVIRKGRFLFHYEQGFSFETFEVAPLKGADVVFKSDSGGLTCVTLAAPGGITNLRALWRKEPDVPSSLNLFNGLVRFDPAGRSLGPTAEGDDRKVHSDVFVVRTPRGGWAKLAIVFRAEEHPEEPVSVEYVHNTREPRFSSNPETYVEGGFAIDRAAMLAPAAPIPEVLVRERARAGVLEKLARLDVRAKRLGESLAGTVSREVRVAAVLQREHARPMGWPDDARISTFSFEHAGRDGIGNTRQAWDFMLSRTSVRKAEGWAYRMAFEVRCVTDDRGFIWEFGNVDFDAARAGVAPSVEPKERFAIARKDHVYVIHVLDTNTDTWALLQVLELTPDESIVFRWEILEQTSPLIAALWDTSRDLKAPLVRLQLRGGAGGGNPNRVFMDGSKNGYVDEIATTPLDFAVPILSSERFRAFVAGGTVPRGQVFVVREIEYRATVLGDSNGDGEFRLCVGPYLIAHIEEARGSDGAFVHRLVTGAHERLDRKAFPVSRTLSVRIPIRPGEEGHVFAEIANSSQCDVVLRGSLLDEREVEGTAKETLTYKEVRRVQYCLDPKYENFWGKAELVKMGERILPHLETLLAMGAQGELRRRIEEVVEEIRGG
jgi:RNA polymerase sigma factor (sigma-70 family)